MADNGFKNILTGSEGTPVSYTSVQWVWWVAVFNTATPHGFSNNQFIRNTSTDAAYVVTGYYIYVVNATSYYLTTLPNGEGDTLLWDDDATGTTIPLFYGGIGWYQDDVECFKIWDTAGPCYAMQEDGYFKVKDSSNNTVEQIWETV